MNLYEIIDEAALIRKQYPDYNNAKIPLAVETYLDLIAAYKGFTIRLSCPKITSSWRSNHIRGWINRSDHQKTARIFIAKQKNDRNDPDPSKVSFCEHRFIAIKEACHLLIDTEKTYTRTAESLIQNLLFSGSQASLNEMPEPYQSEVYAMVAALELLFPWKLRESRKVKIENNEISYYDVANEFKIPERWVFWVLSKDAHPALMDAHTTLAKIKGDDI